MSTVKGFNTTLGVLKYDAESLDNYNTPLFDSTSTYEVGDYVIKDGKLYRCITDVSTAGNWSSVSSNFVIAILTDDIKGIKEDVDDLSTDFSTLEGNVGTLGNNVQTLSNSVGTLSTDVNNLTTSVGKINNSIALPFSTSTSYAIGDYVLYGGSLYRFTDAHTAGAWTGTDAIQVQLAEQLTEEGVFVSGGGTNSVVQKNESEPNTASGEGAIAAGKGAIASGDYSFAFGCALDDPGSITPCTASAEGAIALGRSAVANNKEAVALGHRTTASGHKATAINSSTTASGDCSFAAGNFSIASGLCSSAIGQVAEAQSVASVALGDRVISTGRACTVVGSMNALDESDVDTSHGAGARKYLFIVGNGISTSARSNALTVDWDGNEELAGNLTLNKGATNEFTINGDIIKASIPHDTASGSIASFPDGAAMPVIDCSVAIEPVQDLNGYDNPWPAGGGKNLFDKSKVGTLGIITWAYESGFALKGGQSYTLSVESAGSSGLFDSIGIYGTDKSTQYAISYQQTLTYTPVADTVVVFRFYKNTSVTQAGVDTIQFELGTTATAWSPYSNICPISGWTGATVTRTGINVWDEEWEVGGYNQTTGNKYTDNTRIRSKNPIPIKGGESYYTTGRILWLEYGADGTYIGAGNGGTYVGPNQSFTPSSDAYYIAFQGTTTYGTTYNNDISINYPSTDHDYHAYQGQTYTIDLDGTRYGGTLDVTSGKMYVEKVSLDLGTLSFTRVSYNGYYRFYSGSISNIKTPTSNGSVGDIICEIYKTDKVDAYGQNNTIGIATNGRIFIYDNSYTTASALETALDGVTAVYSLVSPIEIDLTPNTAISTLYGTNNIWADAGNIIVNYYADTTLFINKKIAAAIAALS